MMHFWTDVRNGLPNKNGEYLITRKLLNWKFRGKDTLVVIDQFDIEDGWKYTNADAEVIAWREIPEPYQRQTV